MINATDNFLPQAAFEDLQQYCNETEFVIETVGEKQFSCLPVPKYLYEFLQIPDHHIVLTFIRSAHKDFDFDARIHADNVIAGHKTALASVLYINDENEIERNGTAFWKHYKHGHSMPENISNEEFDRLLKEDANDESKWTKTSFISSRPNRMLTYSSNDFHSKLPFRITFGVRKVLVCFYSKKSKI